MDWFLRVLAIVDSVSKFLDVDTLRVFGNKVFGRFLTPRVEANAHIVYGL